MKRFITRSSVKQSSKNTLLECQIRRNFASGPQKNPYTGIKKNLSIGNQKYGYFSLPALQDKRIGNIIHQSHFHREIAIFDQNIARVSH